MKFKRIFMMVIILYQDALYHLSPKMLYIIYLPTYHNWIQCSKIILETKLFLNILFFKARS